MQTGFKNMKNFLSDCKKHEKAKSHMGAYKTWKTYGFQPRIDCLMSQTRREEIQRHNEEVDEATDVSTKEQLSVIVRMDKGKVSLKDSLGLLMLVVIGLQLLYHQWLRRILEQSSILYSILQDKDTDFHYGMSRFERFKAFVASLRNDTEYCQVYDLAVEKVGPPVTRISIHKDILSEKEDANTLHDEVVKKFIENHEDLLSYTNRYSYMADSKLMMSYVHGM
ncbi:uncharacterized protein LOC124458037 isoform X4 [Xenia sp. Carnegie-2017]|uniref:uncharacterized protein LOC124458037 isoform X4 n=1 Tax=Xenia sp. Carnegie-2017 TaxID=2897299 RepID=UPI001F048AC9|nr:uncharacterized protein LOC124458037 isoform X4 [Xenia sp. Carnegie-2017]